jgi:citrate lyase subunit alpha/citrate CoA-transferase
MRDLPDHVDGYGAIRRHCAGQPKTHDRAKLLPGLDAALSACEVKNGATVSFHHHLRNGDGVLNLVMDAIARRGLKDIHVAATSIFPVHAPLVEHIRNGVVGRISAGFIAGPVGEAISHGALNTPVRFLTHGGRARALDQGDLVVDAAFVAAPSADEMGNISGREGSSACGTLGYPKCDVENARFVVAVTDTLAPFPVAQIDIPQEKVDFVVAVERIGDPGGISSGATRPATDPVSLRIGETAAAVIAASGELVEGFSFQTGAGGISLATAAAVGREMSRRGITGSFAAGGITAFHVEMLQAGLFRELMDVQCFDLTAVQSYKSDPRHQSMSAAAYAGPHIGGAVVDRLSAVVLGAAEIDLNFNVNVTTKANGVIMGGSGGHADTAQGARLSLITTRLTAAGYPKVVDEVGVITTPGETVDVLVTEAGVAVNPRRPDLADRLRDAGLTMISIESMRDLAAAAAERRPHPRSQGRVVAVSEYRDGTVNDVIRQVSEG